MATFGGVPIKALKSSDTTTYPRILLIENNEIIPVGAIKVNNINDNNTGIYVKQKGEYYYIPRIIIKNLERYSDSIQNRSVITQLSQETINDLTDICVDENANRAFWLCRKLQNIPQSLVDTWNTEDITNTESMFENCNSILSIPYFDTSNVTNMHSMFDNCSLLTNIPSFDTHNVINMGFMFSGCENLTSDADIFKTIDFSNVRNISGMFRNCKSLASNPNIFKVLVPNVMKNITDTSYLFYGCSSLTNIPQINTSTVTDMDYMFSSCWSLADNADVFTNFDTSNVTTMIGMFFDCKNMVSAPNLDTRNVIKMSSMFSFCYKLKNVPQFNTSKVTSMTFMFRDCSALENIPQLDTSNVTDMGEMFRGCTSLVDDADIFKNLNTSKVTNMSEMFASCTKLENIPQLDISKVNMIYGMFNNCTSLKSSADVFKNFNVNVQDMDSMFFNCTSLTTLASININIGEYFSANSMCEGCTSLIEPPQFNINQVSNQNRYIYLERAFYGCTSLTNIPYIDFDRNVYLKEMFYGCTSLPSTFPWVLNFNSMMMQLYDLYCELLDEYYQQNGSDNSLDFNDDWNSMDEVHENALRTCFGDMFTNSSVTKVKIYFPDCQISVSNLAYIMGVQQVELVESLT